MANIDIDKLAVELNNAHKKYKELSSSKNKDAYLAARVEYLKLAEIYRNEYAKQLKKGD